MFRSSLPPIASMGTSEAVHTKLAPSGFDTGAASYGSLVKARRVNQQVTLLFCNNGTSETACDITFQFNNYLNLKPLHKKKLDQRFLEWFIGFTEGKGYFTILKNKVYFGITLNLDNIQVLYDIKKQLGFGKVLIRKESSPSYFKKSGAGSLEGVFYVTPGLRPEASHNLLG